VKFTVERDRFADAVAWASRSAATRPLMPYLLGILIEAEGQSLTLSGYDLEVSGKASIEADVATSGRVLVPGRLLAEISRLLPDRPVTLALEGTKVQVTCGSARFSLPTLAISEYPSLPELPEASGTIDGDLFASAVAQVAIAAGKDDSLPVLTGVNVEVEKDRLTLVATDRYRLAVRELPWRGASAENTTALIRGRTLNDAARALSHADQVSLGLTPASAPEQRVGFAADGRVMTSRMLDGTFPPYRHLLPAEASTLAIVEVAPFLDAVRRVALVTEKNIPMRLSFADGTLTLEAGGGEDAAASEELPVELEGDAISIAFNAAYLADGLGAVNASHAQMAFTAPAKPAVISARRDGQTDPSYRYLLMPMRYGN
jgi:DNA polymerase-3 subunit beta